MKITIDTVNEFCRHINLKVLTKEYIGIDKKMAFEDENGYRYWTTFHILKKYKKPSCMFKGENIYSIYNINNYIKVNNLKCKLLSESFVNTSTDMVFECSCGKQYNCSLNRFIQQKQHFCKVCSSGALSLNKLEIILKKNNLKAINSIKNKNECLLVEDGEGYKYKTKYYAINNGNSLQKFNTSNPFVIENIHNYIKLNNIQCTLLSEEYAGRNKNLEFKCSCGNIFYRRLDSFIGNLAYICNDCKTQVVKNKNKHNIEYVYDVCFNAGLKPLFTKYENKDDKLLCKTVDGYKVYPTASNLFNGNKYTIFGKSNPYTISNIKIWLRLNDLKCELLSDEYEKNSKKLIFKCGKCESTYGCSWNRMLNEKVDRCTRCSKSQSILEYKMEEYLKEMNFKYETEYKFANCKNILELPFDFAILDKHSDLKLLIECDGSQHYKPTKFGGEDDNKAYENFINLKKRDKIKDEYCKENNIKLIRIPFWEFIDDKYKNRINNAYIL